MSVREVVVGEDAVRGESDWGAAVFAALDPGGVRAGGGGAAVVGGVSGGVGGEEDIRNRDWFWDRDQSPRRGVPLETLLLQE